MFSTGQLVEGAVPYTAENAVCGSLAQGATNGVVMNNADNAAVMTLPADQACAAPIGPKWVASITNWLCYFIDRSGGSFLSGEVCQNPFSFFNAALLLIQAQINAAFKDCSGNAIVIGDTLVTCAELNSAFKDCSGNNVPVGTQIVTCAEREAAVPFVDCSGNPIAAGASIVTCAELPTGAAVFNPFTATGVGAVMNVGTGADADVSILADVGATCSTNPNVPTGGIGLSTYWITGEVTLPLTMAAPGYQNQFVYIANDFVDWRWPVNAPPGTWQIVGTAVLAGGGGGEVGGLNTGQISQLAIRVA